MDNPLQEHAYLFANGKFKIKRWNGIFDLPAKHVLNKDYWKDAQLIARPIEDMTDEEIAEWKAFIYDSNIGRMIPVYASQTAYLLSIGVYPFDQQAFKDGTVININEL